MKFSLSLFLTHTQTHAPFLEVKVSYVLCLFRLFGWGTGVRRQIWQARMWSSENFLKFKLHSKPYSLGSPETQLSIAAEFAHILDPPLNFVETPVLSVHVIVRPHIKASYISGHDNWSSWEDFQWPHCKFPIPQVRFLSPYQTPPY
jgi:hypothetical protein